MSWARVMKGKKPLAPRGKCQVENFADRRRAQKDARPSSGNCCRGGCCRLWRESGERKWFFKTGAMRLHTNRIQGNSQRGAGGVGPGDGDMSVGPEPRFFCADGDQVFLNIVADGVASSWATFPEDSDADESFHPRETPNACRCPRSQIGSSERKRRAPDGCDFSIG